MTLVVIERYFSIFFAVHTKKISQKKLFMYADCYKILGNVETTKVKLPKKIQCYRKNRDFKCAHKCWLRCNGSGLNFFFSFSALSTHDKSPNWK